MRRLDSIALAGRRILALHGRGYFTKRRRHDRFRARLCAGPYRPTAVEETVRGFDDHLQIARSVSRADAGSALRDFIPAYFPKLAGTRGVNSAIVHNVAAFSRGHGIAHDSPGRFRN